MLSKWLSVVSLETTTLVAPRKIESDSIFLGGTHYCVTVVSVSGSTLSQGVNSPVHHSHSRNYMTISLTDPSLLFRGDTTCI